LVLPHALVKCTVVVFHEPTNQPTFIHLLLLRLLLRCCSQTCRGWYLAPEREGLWRGLAAIRGIQLPLNHTPFNSRRGSSSSSFSSTCGASGNSGGDVDGGGNQRNSPTEPIPNRRTTRLSSNLKRAFFVGAVTQARNLSLLADRSLWKLWLKASRANAHTPNL
jgi:hypothetical protein